MLFDTRRNYLFFLHKFSNLEVVALGDNEAEFAETAVSVTVFLFKSRGKT
jgi:hypothetical protein